MSRSKNATVIDRAVQVFPLPADLDEGLVHLPALSNRALRLAEHSCQDISSIWRKVSGYAAYHRPHASITSSGYRKR
jgi:hypothetical protein